MTAYFDNSATTKPCEEAAEAAEKAIREIWGNPSSLHYAGTPAVELLEKSREAVAEKLRCSAGEIYFTSGGTESDNIALFGAARKMKRYGRRIVSTVAEHPAVYEALTRLEKDGFEVVRLKIGGDGKIDEKELYDAVTADTILISIMAVNNEVGSIMPVQAAKKAAKRAGSPALVHVDAVQAFGKMPLSPASLGADLMSISAHKIHGIKGAGALYVNKNIKIDPLSFGGEQEHKLRPGTEAMPAIAAFGAAANALPDIKAELEIIREKRDRMVERLTRECGALVNSPADALPYVTNISVPGIKSEPMLNFLSARGVCVSSGSACSKGKKSRVLKEMGLDPVRLDSPVRISFSRFTTGEEIDYLVDMICLASREIRRTK